MCRACRAGPSHDVDGSAHARHDSAAKRVGSTQTAVPYCTWIATVRLAQPTRGGGEHPFLYGINRPTLTHQANRVQTSTTRPVSSTCHVWVAGWAAKPMSKQHGTTRLASKAVLGRARPPISPDLPLTLAFME